MNNRAFGKDITNKVLNQSGTLSLQTDMEKYRHSISSNQRKPSPGVHSNYQQPTKERNIQPQVSFHSD